MGLFDFFKKKPSEKPTEPPVDNNLYLIEVLRNKLIQMGYQVEIHPEYLALIINAKLEIATVIIDNAHNHHSILHLMVLTIHPKYFPEGIEENIVGIGMSIHEKVNSVLDNYINTTFLPIIDSLSDAHNPDLDFNTVVNGSPVLWHPKLGTLTFQGQWSETPQHEPFFELLKEKIKNKLGTHKLNWLKIYISKRTDGVVIGECLFNNQPWEEGLEDITQYAQSWELHSDFQAMKEFMVFRRCDASDV